MEKEFIKYIKSLNLSRFELLESNNDELEILSLTYISNLIIARLTLLHGLSIIIDIIDMNEDKQLILKKYDNENIASAITVLNEFIDYCVSK